MKKSKNQRNREAELRRKKLRQNLTRGPKSVISDENPKRYILPISILLGMGGIAAGTIYYGDEIVESVSNMDVNISNLKFWEFKHTPKQIDLSANQIDLSTNYIKKPKEGDCVITESGRIGNLEIDGGITSINTWSGISLFYTKYDKEFDIKKLKTDQDICSITNDDMKEDFARGYRYFIEEVNKVNVAKFDLTRFLIAEDYFEDTIQELNLYSDKEKYQGLINKTQGFVDFIKINKAIIAYDNDLFNNKLADLYIADEHLGLHVILDNFEELGKQENNMDLLMTITKYNLALDYGYSTRELIKYMLKQDIELKQDIQEKVIQASINNVKSDSFELYAEIMEDLGDNHRAILNYVIAQNLVEKDGYSYNHYTRKINDLK
ncbi:hypothetical protein ACFL1H_08150 [Nanoarchaeota archaeon]